MVYNSESSRATQKLAYQIAKFLKRGDIVCVTGELGAGKTTFIKGLAAYFGIDKNRLISNSFLTLRQYEAKIPIYHFDAYRLNERSFLWDDFYIGLYEKKALIIIEWADRILPFLDSRTVEVKIERAGLKLRKIYIKGIEKRLKNERFGD